MISPHWGLFEFTRRPHAMSEFHRANTRVIGRICLVAALFPLCSLALGADEADEWIFPRVITPLLERGATVQLSSASTPVETRVDGPQAERIATYPGADSSGVAGRVGVAARVAESDDGIVVVYPGSLASGEQLHMDIASLATLDLPEIGWYRRFNQAVSYSDEQACAREHPEDSPNYSVADCMRWYREQAAHRVQLADQFIRRLDIDRSGIVKAHDTGGTRLPLHPTSMPIAGLGEEGITVSVPWGAMPATDKLLLDRIYLRIAVCPSAVHSDRASECREVELHGRQQDIDKPRPFVESASIVPVYSTLLLGTPRLYQVTPCALPLQGDVEPGWGAYQRGFFLPGKSFEVIQVMAMHQPPMTSGDSPNGLSPNPLLSKFESFSIGEDEWLCFPRLTWRRGDVRVADTSDWATSDGASYRWLPVDATNLLIISGPFEHNSQTGMGQCGACPRKALAIWYLDRDAQTLTSALAIDDIVQGFEEGETIDVTVAESGRSVHYIRNRCTYVQNDASSNSPSPESSSRQCGRLRVDWCLNEGAREFSECHRSEEALPASSFD
jgi:hypothetical protein